MSDKSHTAKSIIEQVLYITIATVSDDGQPWNTPAYSAYDSEFNFYWCSNIESQHSQNILANGKAFLAIYDSTVPAGEGEGVYVKASAGPLEDVTEIQKAYELLRGRATGEFWSLEEIIAGSPVKIFKAAPEQMWVNDEGEADEIYIDTRTEVKL